MACYLFSGLQGAGKGYYTVLRAEEVLCDTDQHIITNFAFELMPWCRQIRRRVWRAEKGFVQYLKEKYGKDFDATKRIHFLDELQMKQFYLWRVNTEGKLVKIDPKFERKGNRDVIVGFDEGAFAETLGCVYIMDEAWRFINSRDWQDMDRGFQFYLAQQRKSQGGDDFWIVCQHSSQIEKQSRVLISEYHTLVNHRFRKIMFWKQPNVISCMISNEPPELRSKSISTRPKIFRFDKEGVGGSFDTSKGAGLKGGTGADIEKKTKGLPAWTLMLVVVGFGLLVISVARGAGWFAGKLLTGTVHGKAGQAVVDGAKTMSAPWVPPQKQEPQQVQQPVRYDRVETNELQVTGIAMFPWKGYDVITLSDGRVMRLTDQSIQGFNLEQGWFVIDGKKVKICRQK